MLLVDRAHQSRRRGQDLVHKDEDGLFRSELDSFTDDVDKLADGQVLLDEKSNIDDDTTTRMRQTRRKR